MDLGDFGFWILEILDFGSWGFWILDFGSWGFWILDFGAEIQNPKSPNPKSKIQTFLADFGDFGFWILDPYVANLYVAPNFGDFGFWILGILDFGFWIWGILDFGFWIRGILDFGFWGFWILDFGFGGFWILDFGDSGFWILDRYVANLYVRPPTPQIWGILDFGFWGFWGFWILDFGDFGFWFLVFGDFGFWILDFVTNFGCYIRRRRLCTPNRVGGFWLFSDKETRKQMKPSRTKRSPQVQKQMDYQSSCATKESKETKKTTTETFYLETKTISSGVIPNSMEKNSTTTKLCGISFSFRENFCLQS